VGHERADFVELTQAVAQAVQFIPAAFVARSVGNRFGDPPNMNSPGTRRLNFQVQFGTHRLPFFAFCCY